MTDIAVGGYLPGDSVLHRLDPRIKLLGLIVMLVLVFLPGSTEGLIVTALGTVTVLVLSGAGWRVWASELVRFKWMLVIAASLNLFFGQGGEPLRVAGWELPITLDGVRSATIICLQLLQAIIFSMTLTFTTTPTELTRGFERLAYPLKYFKVPVAELGLVMLLAMRFVPLLQQELRNIVDAQKARGVDFSQGPLLDRAGALRAILIPALTGTIKRADLLAVAMSARGFRPGEPRSEYRPLEFRRIDLFAVTFLVSLVACQLLAGRVGNLI